MMRINLIEYFIEASGKYPTRTAVIEGDKKISFQQLKKSSVSLAYEIIGSLSLIESLLKSKNAQ